MNTLAASRWPNLAGSVELVCGIALLIIIARIYRKQYHSWAWARGALIGGLFPLGMALFQFTFHY